MGLTSSRWITIVKTLHVGDALRSGHHAGCSISVERAADRYTFTSALPVQILRMLGPTLETLIASR